MTPEMQTEPLTPLLAMAAASGGFPQDMVTRIINVHWGGLAVEFGDKDEDA